MTSTSPPDANVLEVNFDGLVGPTHNYAGLSVGNLASMGNAGSVSSPRQAARQGVAKMRHLHNLGVAQGVLPPQQRPDPAAIEALGAGSLVELARTAPGLIPLVMSASPMWAANAATVSPSTDTADGRVHLTPANLSSTPHRSFESVQTYRILRAMFADAQRFCVHAPLPLAAAFADEGAANHGRLARSHGETGLHVFVFGREGDEPVSVGGFPRRQTHLAGELISASHRHDPERVLYLRQSAVAIDAGAFHNDVVSVMNENVLFTHADAFDDPGSSYSQMADLLSALGGELQVVEVTADHVSLSDTISSYLFNSQLVTLPDGSVTLIAPGEVGETASAAAYLDAAVDDPGNPIASVHQLDLRESMRNGGGPACLRLRVALSATERAALSGRVLVDDGLLDELDSWIDRHYRDELRPEDLIDPDFVAETLTALDDLTSLLQLGDLYPFQQ